MLAGVHLPDLVRLAGAAVRAGRPAGQRRRGQARPGQPAPQGALGGGAAARRLPAEFDAEAPRAPAGVQAAELAAGPHQVVVPGQGAAAARVVRRQGVQAVAAAEAAEQAADGAGRQA